jgi:glutathione synthase
VRFLFVMDPAESMLPDKDTTFAFMRAALAKGHRVLHAGPIDLYNEGAEVFAKARPLHVSDKPPHVMLGHAEEVDLSKLEAVFIRKDPPFDTAYLQLTRQLELLRGRTLLINDPQGLRDANEKLFAFHFTEFTPKSLVSSDAERIREFVVRSGGKAVLKPLDGAGGSGVVTLDTADKNLRALIDILSHEGKRLVLVQEFLPEVRQGDKRVLMLDGAPLGAILRVPRDDDFRANIHVGGRVERTELGPAELELVNNVGKELKRRGLVFVGLDLIAGKLIEINVTSPTGIQELGRLTGTRPEQAVIEWVEKHVLKKPA